MKLNKLIIAGLASAALVTVSSAKPEGDKKPKGPKVPFEEVDTDEDGKVSEAEFLVHAKSEEKGKEIFVKKDKDGDGFLTEEEFAKRGKKGPKKKKDDA